MKWLVMVVAALVLAGLIFGTPALAPPVTAPTQSSSTSVATEIPLTISSPSNGAIVSTPVVVVKGTTAPRAEVFINDSEANADARGYFSLTIGLDPGENVISILAVDENGLTASQELNITYQ